MTPTKLLIGQILVVFAIVIAGIWFATEWCASEPGFEAQLGTSWFILLGFRSIAPGSSSRGGSGTTSTRQGSSTRPGAIAASSSLAVVAIAAYSGGRDRTGTSYAGRPAKRSRRPACSTPQVSSSADS